MTGLHKEVATQSVQLVATTRVRVIGHHRPAWAKVLAPFEIQQIPAVESFKIRIPKVMQLITTTLRKVFTMRQMRVKFLLLKISKLTKKDL
jgi:hypothetical protein